MEEELSPAMEWKNKGNAAYKKKDYEEAINCYDKAIELNPKEMNFYGNKVAVLTN